MYHIYSPVNFNSSFLPKSLHHFEDEARILIHIILVRQMKTSADESEFVPLKARRLQSQTSQRYFTRIRQALVDSGAIEYDRCYIVGEKCFGFRLGPKLRRQPVIKYPIAKSLYERGQIAPRVELRDATHEHLWKWLQHLDIDYAEALKVIKPNQRNCTRRTICLDYFHNKRLYFCSDDRGRVYHNLVNLWSEFRPYLRVDGQPLVNLDIANCQPLLFCDLLSSWLQEQEEVISSHTHSPTTYMIRHFETAIDKYKGRVPLRKDMPYDVAAYWRLCEMGTLYKALKDLWGYTRSIKRSVIANCFFAKTTKAVEERKIVQLFQRDFPNVWRAIKYYKRNDYKNLALKLQRLEAEIMIGDVVKWLAENKPEVPVFTIHDSIMTTEANSLLVRMKIREAFERKGLAPHIKAE